MGVGAGVAGAIDFGGTKLMAGLIAADGTVLASAASPTPLGEGPSAVADLSAAMLRTLLAKRGLAEADLCGVGATVPGLADTEKGILRYAPASGWREVPFAAMLRERLGLPVRIANDVNACALAEQRFGAGRGLASLVWITVSTGIGGGLVINGEILAGSSGIAGEVGHLVVEEGGPRCGCGHLGCLEAVAAGPAIARRAQAAGLSVTSAAEAAERARAGDPVGLQVFEETAVYLGRAAAFCANLLDPDLVVFGGGVSRSLDLMLPTIAATAAARAIRLPERPLRIAPTALGYNAALIGAGALALPSNH